MGGGRLVILPKKSYCPWKPENVERVLRDERLEKEQRSEQKISRPDQIRQYQEEATDKKKEPERFRLFQREEDEHLNKVATVVGTEKKKVGIMPVMLGQTEIKMKTKLPFYLKKPDAKPPDAASNAELKRKDRLDPMIEFAAKRRSVKHRPERTVDDHKKKKKKKKDKRKHHSKHDSKRDMIDELRRKRREREAKEAQRALELARGPTTSKRQEYHNQYSRK